VIAAQLVRHYSEQQNPSWPFVPPALKPGGICAIGPSLGPLDHRYRTHRELGGIRRRPRLPYLTATRSKVERSEDDAERWTSGSGDHVRAGRRPSARRATRIPNSPRGATGTRRALTRSRLARHSALDELLRPADHPDVIAPSVTEQSRRRCPPAAPIGIEGQPYRDRSVELTVAIVAGGSARASSSEVGHLGLGLSAHPDGPVACEALVQYSVAEALRRRRTDHAVARRSNGSIDAHLRHARHLPKRARRLGGRAFG
jgi:hypothetical protein